MADYRDHHATIFLPAAVAGAIEAARREWDPDMAPRSPRTSGSVMPPHVTIVHPRTSPRGRECWESGSYRPLGSVFTVEEVTVTAFDGARWITLVTCPLGGKRPRRRDELAEAPDSA